MGIFDLFGKDTKLKTDRILSQSSSVNFNNQASGPISVFYPTSFNDVEAIIDCLKQNKNAIVHFKQLKSETSIRILDMLSGAVYALGGGVYEMEKNIFMFSPCGLSVR